MSAKSLLDHVAGCTPADPCINCLAMSFLRTRLKLEDYRGFITILKQPKETPCVDTGFSKLDMSIEELELGVRSFNLLRNIDVRTVRQLVQKTEPELLRTASFSRRSVNEIKEALARLHLGLGMTL